MGSVRTGLVEVFAEPPAGGARTRLDVWKSVSVARRLDAIAGEFQLQVPPGTKIPISRGWKVTILLDGSEVLSGYVEGVRVSEGQGPSRIEFVGRDLAADLVDSTPDAKDVEWTNLWLDELLAKLVPEGTGLVLDTKALRALGPVIPLFRLNQGESYQRAIERACRLRGALPYSLPTGEVAIAPPFGARHNIVLQRTSPTGARTPVSVLVPEIGAALWSVITWGENLKSYQLDLNDADRFRTYIVKGQAGGLEVDLGLAAFQPKGRALDLTMRSSRQLVVVAETSTWGDDAQVRAEWEASWRAAQASKMRVDVPGWRPTPGRPLWAVNQFVRVSIGKRRFDGPAPAIAGLVDVDLQVREFLAGNLLVNALAFTKDESGATNTVLELVRPDAYKRLPEIDRDVGLFAAEEED